jgi:hypothetical protein
MSSARTDVFRSNYRVATVTNDGAYTDRLGRRAHGTYTYRVCAAGTATCSPNVSVTVGSAFAARQATGASRAFARKARRAVR